jgi:hypothetical protein
MEKSNLIAKGNGGFAVILGLIILFAVTISGMALLYISSKDKTATTDYAKVRVANVAAQSALKACVGKLQMQPDSAVKILQSYLADHSKCWLLSGPASAGTAQRYDLTSGLGAHRYSAKILAFDPTDLIIQIQGIGEGSDAQKKVVGIYKLSGMSTQAASGYALYLNEGKNFDNRVTVNGDVYINSKFHFNAGSNLSVINGNLKSGVSNTDTCSFGANITINGNVFIQSLLKANGDNRLTVNGLTGVLGNIWIDGTDPVHCNDNAFFTSTVTGSANVSSRINMHNHSYTYVNGTISSRISNASSNVSSPAMTGNDVALSLGMKSGNETPWQVDLTKITVSPRIINNEWQLSADKLNTFYSSGNKCTIGGKEYLVLKLESGQSAGFNNGVYPNGNEFNGNVIWIIEGTLHCNSAWILPSSNTLQFIVVQGSGLINQFGGASVNGYIHVKNSGKINYDLKGNAYYTNMTLNGALHHIEITADSYQSNAASNNFVINYDQAVLDNFIAPGLIVAPNVSGGTQLILTDVKIRTQLLSLSY